MKLWGGRFEGEPSEIFERFSGSLSFDKKLIIADVHGSRAWVRALEGVGILSAEEREILVGALGEVLQQSLDPAFYDGAMDEDVHTLVIRKLKERAGAVVDKIHTGRSRNEQVSLDLRMHLRSSVDALQSLLRDFLERLLAVARQYREAVIPGYTHLRRAQPVLWPHYILAYFEMFMRDHQRFTQARARINAMPLGSGALAGAGFPMDRDAIARELDFTAVTHNSMDAAGDRDFALDFLYCCSTTMLHLSRLAEDWILYSSEEFGWMALGDAVTSGSSLMPQKKNPDSLELIRGKCGRVFGDLMSLFITMKGLPMTYDRDMQEDKEPLFDALRQLEGCLMMAAVVADSVQINPDRALAAVQESWTIATDLAEALARNGTPFHRAHQLVGELVLESVRSGKRPSDWTSEALAAFDPAFTPQVARYLRVEEGIQTREITGGTGPRAVAAALEEAQSRLAALRK